MVFKITSGPLIPLGGEIQTPMNQCRTHPKHLLCLTELFYPNVICQDCLLFCSYITFSHIFQYKFNKIKT